MWFKRGEKVKTKRLLSIIFLFCFLSFFYSIFPLNNVFYNNSELSNNNINNELDSLKSSAAPEFSINSPKNYTLYGKTAPNFSLTIDQGLGNYSWYEFLETGESSIPTELDGIANENVTDTFIQSLWDNLANGTATIRFYINNSLGETGYNDTIIRIDIIDPDIEVISPTSGFFNSTPPDFTIEIFEPNLNKTWYTLNANTTKHFFQDNSSIDYNAWIFEADGNVDINFFANDSVGNEDFKSAQIIKDVVAPTKPLGLNAIPSSWTNTNSYNLSWSNPSDTSGIVGAYYKVGAVPLTDTDGIYVQGNDIEAITNINVGADGIHDVYVWLKDGAGNINFSNYETTQLSLDSTIPVITDLQAGDDIWRNAAGTTYDVDFLDPDPSSNLDYAQYKITTAPDQGGTVLLDWTNIFTGFGATTYTDNWTIDFTACQEGINYISVRVYDDTGNMAIENDTFYVKKDTTSPIITDLQAGDDIWRNAAGTTYDVDFSDPDPSSNLDYAQYKITTAPDQGGTVLLDWTNIFTGLGATTYTDNWTIDFTACQEGLNYISVRVYDGAGNMAIENDTFYVKKDTTSPVITDLQAGDDIWRNAAGTTYDVDFSDPDPSSNLDYAQYKITTAPDQGGTVLLDWTNIFTGLGATTYTDNWTIDFTACQEGLNYISVRVYDGAGNMAIENDTFYVKKDTINPSLVINSPTDGTEWKNAPNIRVTATDPNLDSVWYIVGGSKIMLTNGVSELLNSSIWESLSPEGSFTIDFYANDSAGNINNTYSYTLYKDVLPPRLVINLPINNTYCANPPPINITVFDSSLIKLFYYMVGAHTPVTLENNTEYTLDPVIWNSLDQGEFIINLFVWDNLDNVNDTYSLRLYKDTLAPEIIINSPKDLTHLNYRPIINITAIDPNLHTVWYRVGTTNITLTSGIEELLNDSIWNSLAEGPFNIEIFANDTFGHFNNSYVLTLYKDTTTPNVIVNLPINETMYNSPPFINVTVFDSYFDTLWYRIGNTNITLTNNTEELLNLTIWDSLPEEGAFLIYFYANDSAGNLNNTFILTLYKDIKAPTIIINSPQPNDLFGDNSPSVSLDVQDANLEEIWYQLTNGTVSTNNYTWTGSINQTVWNQFGNGTVTIRFYANDTFNHLGFAEVTVRKNIYNPIILIENPQENDLFGIIAPNFTIYISGADLNTTWYTLDNGVTNFTFTGLTGTIDQDAWDAFGYGDVTIMFYINDTLGRIGYDIVEVSKDPDPPLVAINSPDDGHYYGDPPDIQVIATDANLDSVWYTVGGTKITLTNGVPEPLDSSIWDSLSEGEFILRIYANDTLGYINDTFILTLYKDTLAPFIVINNPNNQTYYNVPPPINITAYDPNLTNIYYMVGTTQIPLTNNVEKPLDSGIWASLGQGEFKIYIYAWDSLNHQNNTYVITLYKDTNVPTVVINSPSDYSYWNTPPILNVAASDPNLHTIWYKVGTTIIELANNTAQLLDDSIWDVLSEESFVVEIYANDSFGQLNDLFTLTLYKDVTPPSIVINNPQNNTYYSNPPSIRISAIDASIDTIWYTIDGTKIILTNGVPEPLDSVIWDNLPQGEFTVFIFANDSAGNLNDSLSLKLYKDTLAPLVVVNLPFNNTYWNSGQLLNIIAYDPNNVSISYRVYNYVQSIANNTDTLFNPGIWSYVSEGMFILEIVAEDSFHHLNDTIKLTLYKDTQLPQITINLPQPNDLFGTISPNYDLSIFDVNLNSTWYTLIGDSVNYTFTGATGKISQTAWDSFPNGTITIRFYANDTAKNMNYKQVVVRKNIYAPIITVNSPFDNQLFGISAPSFEIYKSGIEIDTTWYTLIGDSVNYTFTGTIGIIYQTAWDSFGFGLITIRFYINDTLGRVNFDEITVRKDPDIPIILINSPNNHSVYASSPSINVIISEPNLDTIWYRVGTSIVQLTNNTAQLLDLSIWNSLAQGTFIIYLFANDTLGNLNDIYHLSLSKDTIGPNITIILPYENQKLDRNAPYFELSLSDENGIDSSWYRIEGGDIYQFTGTIGRIDQTLWENLWDNLTQGDKINIRFYSNDTLGNENYKHIIVLKEEPLNFFTFFTNPIGMILPVIGVGIMLPITVKLTTSRYYKSLDKKEKSKLKNVLILSFFFLSLTLLFYIF